MDMSSVGRLRGWLVVVLAALVPGFLTGCDSKPPSDKAKAAISQEVRTFSPNVFEGGDATVSVDDITIASWKKSEGMNGKDGAPLGYDAEWTANLRFKEPIALILVQVDGVKVVRVMADTGEKVAFSGRVSSLKADGKWEAFAYVSSSFDAGPWTPLWNKANGAITMGYSSVTADSSQVVGRGPAFQPLSALKPYVIEGSAEEKKLSEAYNERVRKQQEAAAAAAEARRQMNEAAQKQREAEYQANLKKQQEAAEARRKEQEAAYAEQQRVAAEAAKARAAEAAAKAEEARRAKIAPMVAPFKSPSGQVITADAGQTLGSVILTATVDDSTFKTTGTGIDLRTMPFREYTFESTADDRAGVSYLTPLIAAPVVFGLQGTNLVSRAAGLTLTPLTGEDRTKLDAHIAHGKRLGGAAAQVITPEILDAAAAKTRETGMQTTPLTGVVLYKDRNGPTVLPMFAGDLAANKAYRWAKETIAIRLPEPVKGKALYIRATNAATDNLVVIINGVHRCTIDAIAKLGGAIVPLPADLEILDIRLDALGTAQVRGVMLVK